LRGGIKESDALILYSRYETFGCVLIEAFACGVPVIVTDIHVLHENVNDTNGLFVESENPIDLANKIISFISKKSLFNSNEISRVAIKNYSYEKVGLLLKEWYQTNNDTIS
jgi:glycosyltransferase involved in cell wall biosynthesis